MVSPDMLSENPYPSAFVVSSLCTQEVTSFQDLSGGNFLSLQLHPLLLHDQHLEQINLPRSISSSIL